MTKEMFLQTYWRHYLLLENDFIETTYFVELAPDNFTTYSAKFLKLLLAVGSEIDVALREYCRQLGAQGKLDSIAAYRTAIKTYEQNGEESLHVQTVLSVNEIRLKPWDAWYSEKEQSPDWWNNYNTVKHKRTSVGKNAQANYKLANLENVFNALGALYQILLNLYKQLVASSDRVRIPLRGSKLFRLSSPYWDKVKFFGEYALYVNDTGEIVQETGIF